MILLLPFAARAAILEEVVVVAAILLLERGQAPRWAIYATVLARPGRLPRLHGLGGRALGVPVSLGLRLLYLRYRDLPALITAHAINNVVPTLLHLHTAGSA
ncbi:MAG: hypothetical protein GEU94_10215 [Micromonosporaceae bacterium]|nr:hypothetical protein [Micromonosporaceae bacterium]